MTAGNVDRITIHDRPSPCIALAHESAEARRVLADAAMNDGFDVVEACSDTGLWQQLARWIANGGREPDVLVLASELHTRMGERPSATAGTILTMVIASTESERARMEVPGSDVRAVMVWPFDPDDFVTVARFLARRAYVERSA